MSNRILLILLFLFILLLKKHLIFFLNPELIVNIILLLFFFFFFLSYSLLNQKTFLFQKNEVRKKNFLFFQNILLQWKKLQLRNKIISGLFLLFYLKDLFLFLNFEFSKKKENLAIFLKKFLIVFLKNKMYLITFYLIDKETIKKNNKAELLSLWFNNNISFINI